MAIVFIKHEAVKEEEAVGDDKKRHGHDGAGDVVRRDAMMHEVPLHLPEPNIQKYASKGCDNDNPSHNSAKEGAVTLPAGNLI